jgi:hypothetical protein
LTFSKDYVQSNIMGVARLHDALERLTAAICDVGIELAAMKAEHDPHDAVDYAKFFSRSHNAVIRVYDDAGNVIETHEHAGGFSLTNYSELFGGAGLVISLLNGGAALTGKSGRKTPNACDISERETNIDAAAQIGYRMRLNSSGRSDLPGLLWILGLRQTRCHRNNSAVAFACY